MDAAFCQRAVFRLLTARGCAYAIKVGYWSWLPLKQLAAERQRWLRVMIYRKHVGHESPKNFQLDLFTLQSQLPLRGRRGDILATKSLRLESRNCD